MEVKYRGEIARASGRCLFEAARAGWATAHGLEPDDGAYLVELVERPLTLSQLSEALAICSQTREMVVLTMERLVSRGYVEAKSEIVTQR